MSRGTFEPTEQASADEAVAAWIETARRGDEAACHALYERFVQPVFRLAYGLLLDREDAEEVVQDSFTYAFRNLSHYDPALSAFKTWLFTIAMSRCRNKRRRKWLPVSRWSEVAEWLAGSEEPPERAAARHSAQQAVFDALRKLSPKLREAVVLRYFDGLSFREMAQVIGCPQKTAESRVRLAHDALYRLLADQYETLLEGAFGYEQAR
jgi:RNA polymerase sigma-70 factor (ECF subfamily)